MFFLFFSINYLPFLAASVWMRHPNIVAWYVNWHLGKVRAVTLLAPGRRWSLTYGSASPLESMAFSPCRHKQTHTHTLWCQRWRHHTLKHFTQRTGSKTDRPIRVTSEKRLWMFLTMLLFCALLDSFMLTSREWFNEIYIINVTWQHTVCHTGLQSFDCHSKGATLPNFAVTWEDLVLNRQAAEGDEHFTL